MAKTGPIARLYDALNVLRGRKMAIPPSPIMRELQARDGEQALAKMGLGWGQAGGSGPGTWQFERAEQVRHFRHWVYTCIQFLAAKVTQEPPQVAYLVDTTERTKHYHATKSAKLYGSEPPQRRHFVPPIVLKNASPQIRAGEDLEYVPATHPLRQLLDNPNGPDTWLTFWREAMIFFKLCGVNYTWKVPRNDGNGIAELWNIPAHWVRPVCEGTDRLVDYYEVRPWGMSASPVVWFSPEELIEVKDPNPLNKLGAQSPLQANAEIVDQYESIQQARYWSMKNGANVGTVLQQIDEETYPADQEIMRLEATWLARFQGEQQFNRPQILPRGLQLVRPPSDVEMAYTGSADQIRDYVLAQCFRISKGALGITDGVPWATYVGDMRRLIQDVINPDLMVFGAIFTERLANVDYDDRLKIFWSLQSPHDDTQRLSEWSATPGPAVTVNEYRQHILGLEPLDGEEYDHPLQSAGMVSGGPLDMLDGLLPQPKQNPGESGEKTVKVTDASGHEHAADGKFGSGGGSKKEDEKPTTRAGRAVAAVSSIGSKVLDTRVGRFLKKAEHKFAIVAHKTREIATEAAKNRGLSQEQVDRVGNTLAIADFVGGYVTGIAAGATISPVAGKVAAFLPSVSALYVAYSAAKAPAATWAAARHVVKNTTLNPLAGGEHKAAKVQDWLADWVVENITDDWREAVFLAALAETEDVKAATKAFAEAIDANPEKPNDAPEPTAADFGVTEEDEEGGK